MNKLIIILSGKMQSGKNQIATFISDIYKENHIKVRHESIAKRVKDYAVEDFNSMTTYLNNVYSTLRKLTLTLKVASSNALCDSLLSEISKLSTVPENFYEQKTDLSRIILQTYAENIIRNRVSDNFWINQTITDCINCSEQVILITDVRYKNEIKLFEEFEQNKMNNFDIVKVRIERPIVRAESFNQHKSEVDLDDYKDWDYIIENVGTLFDLKQSAVDLVNSVSK